ncbi:MAG: hypothetical protein HFH09_01290 [Bacilli bacterium]|jgi:hypothetical protein|nr:hypothetical protein [Bacilli bacterium]
MDSTAKLVTEVCDYIYTNGDYPPRGFLSSDGKDLGKALTRFRTGETKLTNEQISRLADADSFLSRTEKNIRELEEYYHMHGCLPLGEEQVRLRDVMNSYKSGDVPITKEQYQRLEAIGVFFSNTERMIQAIEAYCNKYHKAPGRGKKSPEGYDMGSALIGYRSGKRQLTLDQKRRLESKGISLPNATIKKEPIISVRIEERKETLSDKIEKLKAERASLMDIDEKRVAKL